MPTKKTSSRTESARPRAEERRAPGNRSVNERIRTADSVRLSDPSAREDVANLVHNLTRTPKQARAFLIDAGLLTPTGRLPKRFGG